MFSSVESICEEFGLQKSLSKSKLRSELKKRIASIHADKTGGDFPNDAVKQLYLRMQKAVEHLDSSTRASALEIANPGTSALEARVAALEVSNNSKGPSYVESAQRTTEGAGGQYRTGWISSGVFAAVCGMLFPFSKKLSENPFFAPFVGLFWVRVLLSAVLLISGLGFVILRIKELRLKRLASALLSEDGIAWVVRECVNKYNDEPDCALTQRKMMDAICKCGVKWHKLKAVRWLQKQSGTKIPRDLAERIAKLQLSSLIERGVVRRGGILGVEPVYVLEVSLAKEIVDDHGAIFFNHELS